MEGVSKGNKFSQFYDYVTVLRRNFNGFEMMGWRRHDRLELLKYLNYDGINILIRSVK